MKYTNISNLIIKFMGGGLIKFPSRFLKWIKVDGDSEGQPTPSPEPEPQVIIHNLDLTRFNIDWTPTTADKINTFPINIKNIIRPYNDDTSYILTKEDFKNYICGYDDNNVEFYFNQLFNSHRRIINYNDVGFASADEFKQYFENLIEEFDLDTIQDKIVGFVVNRYVLKKGHKVDIYIDNELLIQNVKNFYIQGTYDGNGYTLIFNTNNNITFEIQYNSMFQSINFA